jgi:AcrR family transcriptional regulator
MSTRGYHGRVEPTRDRLLEAATGLLDQGGPAAVTLREVGRLAGVSHNAPYKHFAGKEDLLAAIAARELRRMGAGTAGRASAGDVGRVMRAYIRYALRYPARFKLIFGAWPSGSAELGEAAGSARSGLLSAVEAAQRRGTLPTGDPERVAALIQATAHGAADLALSGHLSPDGKGHASAEDLAGDLLGYLAAAAGPTSPAGDERSYRPRSSR